MALIFDPNDWLVTLIILGSMDRAHNDSKKSDTGCFFSFRKQILKGYSICVLLIFTNSSYTMESCPVW